MANESPDPNVEAVRTDLLNRSRKGVAKYGTTTADNPLTEYEWLDHAQKEAEDLAVYLEARKRQAKRAEAVVEAARWVLFAKGPVSRTEAERNLRDALNRYDNGGDDG